MNTRICRCCGEPMPDEGNPLSRNPNICASCSSMTDGMETSDTGDISNFTTSRGLDPATPEVPAAELRPDKAAEAGVHHAPV